MMMIKHGVQTGQVEGLVGKEEEMVMVKVVDLARLLQQQCQPLQQQAAAAAAWPLKAKKARKAAIKAKLMKASPLKPQQKARHGIMGSHGILNMGSMEAAMQ